MRQLFFITHPDVVIDPDIPVTDWPLNERGRRRMAAFCESGVLDKVTGLYASFERKSKDGAAFIARRAGLCIQDVKELGENDRSATGFLPPQEFEQVADAFFGNPDMSVRGWERAIDAQARIVRAVQTIVSADDTAGDLAIVAHGAVGALLLCARLGVDIDRKHDQPGRGGGNYLTFDLPGLRVTDGWRDIAPETP